MNLLRSASLLSLASIALAAHAQTILGPSALLNDASAATLSNWLGRPVDLTRVFEKVTTYTGVGDSTAYDFHREVGGKGATFVVIEATVATGILMGQTFLIGGYNPQSWWTDGTGYSYTLTNEGRTAFVFNLTKGFTLAQRLMDGTVMDPGQTQTYNSSNVGPTFGGGHDLFVANDLVQGGSISYSYGGEPATTNVIGTTGDVRFRVGRLEVFTLSSPPPLRALPPPFPSP